MLDTCGELNNLGKQIFAEIYLKFKDYESDDGKRVCLKIVNHKDLTEINCQYFTNTLIDQLISFLTRGKIQNYNPVYDSSNSFTETLILKHGTFLDCGSSLTKFFNSNMARIFFSLDEEINLGDFRLCFKIRNNKNERRIYSLCLTDKMIDEMIEFLQEGKTVVKPKKVRQKKNGGNKK